MSQPAATPAHESNPTAILCAVVLATLLGLGMMVPNLPRLQVDLGLSEIAAGAMLSSFGFARMLANAPSGYAVDRLGTLPVAAIGLALVAAGGLVGGLWGRYPGLVAAFVLQGMGAAAFSTAALTTMLLAAGPAHRGRTMSWFQTAILLSFAVGPVIGGYTLEPFGPYAPFWVTLVLTVLCAPALLAMRPRRGQPPRPIAPAPDAPARTAPFAAPLIRRPLIVAAAVGFTAFFSRVGFAWYILPHAASGALSLEAARVGVIVGAGTACNLLVMPLIGQAIDRHGPARVLVTAALVSVIGFALPVVWTGEAGLWLATAIAMIGTGAMIPSASALALGGSHPSQTGRVMGLFRTISDSGMALGPLMVPVIARQMALATGSVALIAAAACAIGFALALVPTGAARRPAAGTMR